MDSARLAQILQPFVPGAELTLRLLDQLQLYLELLLRWNARVNLTSVRDPEQILSRHFGESFFAAQALQTHLKSSPATLVDVGSGAGFPGIPIKLLIPHTALTLIESQNKKATFLRELVRTLQLEDAQVFHGRAEQWHHTADVVTLRAVEQFDRALPVAARLVADGGTLCLLIGSGQLPAAHKLLGDRWQWSDLAAIPLSAKRVVAVAQRTGPVDRTKHNS